MFLKDRKKIKAAALLMSVFLIVCTCTALSGCREYDNKLDVVYFFKTDPEKAVIDFLQSLENNDPIYIYENLLLNSEKNNISKEKFIIEFDQVLNDLEDIELVNTYYLGYEGDMSKVVAEFTATYKNGKEFSYRKYIYLIEENNKWKIVFEKTFI